MNAWGIKVEGMWFRICKFTVIATLSFEIISLLFLLAFLSLRCRYSSLRRLSNGSLSILLLFVQLNLSRPSSNLGKLHHMFSVTLTIQRPYMHFRKTSSHSFRDTDNPTTIYGTSGKLCRMLSATLTIQRPYMALQENFVTWYLWQWRSNDCIW